MSSLGWGDLTDQACADAELSICKLTRLAQAYLSTKPNKFSLHYHTLWKSYPQPKIASPFISRGDSIRHQCGIKLTGNSLYYPHQAAGWKLEKATSFLPWSSCHQFLSLILNSWPVAAEELTAVVKRQNFKVAVGRGVHWYFVKYMDNVANGCSLNIISLDHISKK